MSAAMPSGRLNAGAASSSTSPSGGDRASSPSAGVGSQSSSRTLDSASLALPATVSPRVTSPSNDPPVRPTYSPVVLIDPPSAEPSSWASISKVWSSPAGVLAASPASWDSTSTSVPRLSPLAFRRAAAAGLGPGVTVPDRSAWVPADGSVRDTLAGLRRPSTSRAADRSKPTGTSRTRRVPLAVNGPLSDPADSDASMASSRSTRPVAAST